MTLRNRLPHVGVLLVVCALVVVLVTPRSGFGSLHRSPEAALLDALGPGGWLLSGSEVQLLQLLETPEGRVAVYTDAAGHFGTADAKPRHGRWFAHGIFGLGPLRGRDCWQVPTSGTTVTVAAGRLGRNTASVVVIDQHGNPVVARRSRGIWAAAIVQGSFQHMLALDATGRVLIDEPIDDCGWP